MKRMIEIDDVLGECAESAIEAVKEELDSYIRRNRDDCTELPDLNNGLDYSGAIHQIIDSAVPIYTNQIETAWFLYSNEIEQAYENAGIGDNSREGNGKTALYCYIQEQVKEAWDANAETWFLESWNKLKREDLDECVKSGTAFERKEDRMNHSYWTEEHKYWTFQYCEYGDYDDSCQVERANVRVLKEKFDFISDYTSGAFGHAAACVHEDDLDDIAPDDWNEFIGVIDSLRDCYRCALDDEVVSECEREAEEEAWASRLEADIRRALVKVFEELPTDTVDAEGVYTKENLDELDGDELFNLVTEAMSEANVYFAHEAGGNVYLDVKRIMPVLVKLVKLTILAKQLKG